MGPQNNLALLREYENYLRVEKGLRPLTCEAYSSDLSTFAEFLEDRHATLLTAVQQDVAGFLEHLRTHSVDSRSAARKPGWTSCFKTPSDGRFVRRSRLTTSCLWSWNG